MNSGLPDFSWGVEFWGGGLVLSILFFFFWLTFIWSDFVTFNIDTLDCKGNKI